MEFVITGIAAFGLIHLSDLAALKRTRIVKPVAWIAGILLLVFSAIGITGLAKPFDWPLWASICGYVLLALSLAALVYSLFISLPFKPTYIRTGISHPLKTNGLYGIVRHPGIYPFAGAMLALVMISPSRLMLVGAATWFAIDLALIVVQDRLIFPRMFTGYENYRRQTPMLIPDLCRIGKLVNRFEGVGPSKIDDKDRRTNPMSTITELIKKGLHDALWQRCCGFIDLSIDEFMRIQRRLLLEQIELVKNCDMGRRILDGALPETVDEFRRTVPLTTYADYAPQLLKRKMDGLPKKPILWQCTSGKSGESTFRWVPVTARQLDEIEPLVFALLFFSSCRGRGDINLREQDKVFYGMAPPPYATGTMTRVLPHEIFDFIPPVEISEQINFEDRTKLGFKMALEKGLDMCFAMSSVMVAIGDRFGKGKAQTSSVKSLLSNRKIAIRMLRGIIKSKLAGRKILPRDIWKLKGLITFGLDGVVYRERIKEMWGRYPLDFHGCTEAVVIATQTWDYEGMTFVPNLNFFEFITEEDSIRSYQDPGFVPPTYLMNEIVPGNYELVITSFHGGPFVRYRLGHLVKIHSLRNQKLDIDIPQMSFIGRIDDQIDIAGFTRLSEKIIWQAIEQAGFDYAGWTARKEVASDPILNVYLELKDDRTLTAIQVEKLVHNQLRKLDVPYSELENFTGMKPIKVTLLPRGSFAAYKEHQLENGADITRLKPPHLNPSDDIIAVLAGAEMSTVHAPNQAVMA